MSGTDPVQTSLVLARRHRTPQVGFGMGMRYAMHRAQRRSDASKTFNVVSAIAVVLCLVAAGVPAALTALALALSGYVLGRTFVAFVHRDRIDRDAMCRLASEAQQIMRSGLLCAKSRSKEDDANGRMTALLADVRPNRAEIIRKAAASMVEIRCLHEVTIRDLDASYHEDARKEAIKALRQVRDEALDAIVPLQDGISGTLSERLQAIASPKKPEPVLITRSGPARTGRADFDALVLRVQERIDAGEDPIDASGSRIEPLIGKHLPSLLTSHARAVEEGADARTADAFLERSLNAMRLSFEETLAQPRPTAQSAMDALETQTRFLEARAGTVRI
jgi:hypothetical protein